MAWIESHQGLARHPKLLRLAQRLKVNPAQAIGHLHLLWWWALDYAPDGDVSAFSADEVASAAGWTRETEPFLAALRECRWLDPDGSIHDWQDYGGRYQAVQERIERQREQTRERVRRHRARQDPPATGSETPAVTPAVTVGKRGVKPGNETVTPSNAPTGQDRTRQDRTRQDSECVRASSGVCNVTPVVPKTLSPETETELSISSREPNPGVHPWPTLEEALARADLRAIPRECAEKWWHEHDARGGCDRHGQPLTRWESALTAFATTWRAVEAQQKARASPNGRPNPVRTRIDHSKGF